MKICLIFIAGLALFGACKARNTDGNVQSSSSAEMSLLDAMVKSPEEMLKRLVYADWLEENGGKEEAALIRAWVEIESLIGDGLKAKVDKLMKNESVALIAYIKVRNLSKPDSAFVKAIEKDPTDSLARSVFADWLEENGQETEAKLLRARTEIAIVVADANTKRLKELLKLEAGLLKELKKTDEAKKR